MSAHVGTEGSLGAPERAAVFVATDETRGRTDLSFAPDLLRAKSDLPTLILCTVLSCLPSAATCSQFAGGPGQRELPPPGLVPKREDIGNAEQFQ